MGVPPKAGLLPGAGERDGVNDGEVPLELIDCSAALTSPLRCFSDLSIFVKAAKVAPAGLWPRHAECGAADQSNTMWSRPDQKSSTG
ncbi:unnamed protein product [Parajaminaea phylloscopi]